MKTKNIGKKHEELFVVVYLQGNYLLSFLIQVELFVIVNPKEETLFYPLP